MKDYPEKNSNIFADDEFNFDDEFDMDLDMDGASDDEFDMLDDSFYESLDDDFGSKPEDLVFAAQAGKGYFSADDISEGRKGHESWHRKSCQTENDDFDDYDESAYASEESDDYTQEPTVSKGDKGKTREKLLPVPMLILIDAILIGCSLVVFALFHHVIPTEYSEVSDNIANISFSDINVTADDVGEEEEQPSEQIELPFTAEVIQTENSYSSPNVAVTLTKHDVNGVVYYVQDIYVKSMASFRTAFAKNKYGNWVVEMTPDIAADHNAICAINGDYYGASSTKGIVIRNGTFYRGNGNDDDDILVLFADGTMESYTRSEYNEEALLKRDIWQTWSFGPSLLNKDGSAIEYFKSPIRYEHPRSAVGYYEPGHYCFVAVDGRSDESKGMTLIELSKLFESLGCKVAYNMDGGQTSMMTFGGKLVNDAFRGGRECSDILYICEPDAQ